MVRIKSSTAAPQPLVAEKKAVLQIASAILGIASPLERDGPSNVLRLSRDQAAKFLSAVGYAISANRLAKLAVYGGGPEYRTWGRSVVYEPFRLLEWAQSRETTPRSHTSELVSSNS